MSYELVLSACSHYWNCCLPLTKEPMERVMLRDPLNELLCMIAPLLQARVRKRTTKNKISFSLLLPPQYSKLKLAALSSDAKYLIQCMYGVLFQSFIDKVFSFRRKKVK